MTYERVTIVLTEHEMHVLRKLAQQELRRPRDQAAYILRNILAVPNTCLIPENSKSASVKVAQTHDHGAFAGINS